MTLEVFSFDFDGSLLHSKDKEFIASNKDLINSIKASKNKKISIINSCRQSLNDDYTNAAKDQRGSCYPAIEKINDSIGAKFDPFLLTDLYNNFEPGHAFKQASQYVNKDTHLYDLAKVAKDKPFPNWIHDSGKLTILYAQMHKIALENPKDLIEFNFLDDRKDILDSLHQYFSKYPNLIPPNVILKLQAYAGPVNKDGQDPHYTPIVGARTEADKEYKLTVKNMAAVTIEQMTKKGIDITSSSSAKPIRTYTQAEENNFDIAPINCIQYYKPDMLAENPFSVPSLSDSFKLRLSFGGLFKSRRASQTGSQIQAPVASATASRSTPNLPSSAAVSSSSDAKTMIGQP